MTDLLMSWLGLANADSGAVWVQILEIIWINILLSGDNAVVIALACRALPPRQRMWGIILGAGVAVILRIIFTIFVAKLMLVPWLKITGGLLLLWIAIKLLTDHGGAEANVAQSTSIWGAVKTVAIADMVMSLDNVLAIAAAAKGDTALIVLGLAISIPLIVFGATLVMAALSRFPILVWAGAALLGWIAGEMIVADPVLEEMAMAWVLKLGLPADIHIALPFWTPAKGWFNLDWLQHSHEWVAAVAGAALVLLVAALIRAGSGKSSNARHPAE